MIAWKVVLLFDNKTRADSVRTIRRQLNLRLGPTELVFRSHMTKSVSGVRNGRTKWVRRSSGIPRRKTYQGVLRRVHPGRRSKKPIPFQGDSPQNDTYSKQVSHHKRNQENESKSKMKALKLDLAGTTPEEVFGHYLKSNVQVGVADIFEILALKKGMNLSTFFVTAQVGLTDGFKYQAIVDQLNRHYPEITVHVHESVSKETVDCYMYLYEMVEKEPNFLMRLLGKKKTLVREMVGILLVNTSYDKTRCTGICYKTHTAKFESVISDNVKDDHQACFDLTLGTNGIEESRRSIRRSTAPAVYDEYYPFLPCSVEEYFQRFLDSKSGLLLLIGEPGTGKSSFIRALILYAERAGCMVYDKKTAVSILTLKHFYSSTHGILVIEDPDTLLGKRDHGNEDLAGVLNYTDGVVNDPTKKMVVSTNLASVNSVDPAVYREGRCYDVLQFRKLTPTEAAAARARITDLPYREFKTDVPLATALGNELTAPGEKAQAIGFGLSQAA